MSKQRCQQETTSSEFVDWLIFLNLEKEREIVEHQKIDYYLANIVHWVKKTIAKNPDQVKFEDSLFKFEMKKDKDVPKKLTKEEKKDRLQRMKNSIYSWLGVDRSTIQKKDK